MDFDQTAFDHAKSFIQDLSGRPDLLKELKKEIEDVAPPGTFPKRSRTKKAQ
ncbi:MAG TPA: hypothetical protein V6D07_13175 [Trichocoleus sp.]